MKEGETKSTKGGGSRRDGNNDTADHTRAQCCMGERKKRNRDREAMGEGKVEEIINTIK